MKRRTGHQILCSAFENPAIEADKAKYHSRTWGERKNVGNYAPPGFKFIPHSAGDNA